MLHRLADVWVHAGMIARMPYRIDHWAALAMHLIKYAGLQLPKAVTFNVKIGPGSLRFDDTIDVLAHMSSAVLFLGPSAFGSAVALAEGQRWVLRAQCHRHAMNASHHHPQLSKSPSLRRRGALEMREASVVNGTKQM